MNPTPIVAQLEHTDYMIARGRLITLDERLAVVIASIQSESKAIADSYSVYTSLQNGVHVPPIDRSAAHSALDCLFAWLDEREELQRRRSALADEVESYRRSFSIPLRP